MLCGMELAALAEEVTIAATVPDSHTISVSADGVEVFCNGQPGSRFTVDRLSEPTLLIRAKSGRRIAQVFINGQDITDQVRGGYYTLPPVYEDIALTVATGDEPVAQDETYALQGTIERDGQPLAGVTIELDGALKTDVTDGKGHFVFSDVPCGRHSLTVMENGRVVGHLEILLTEGNAAGSSLSDGVWVLTANRRQSGIQLAMELAEDDGLCLAGVRGLPPKVNPDDGDASSIPQTGDTTSPLFWLVLMVVATAGFVALIVAYGRKGKSEES